DELEARDPPRPSGRRVSVLSVSHAGFSHLAQRVERRLTRALIVRVGASLEELDRKLEVTVLDRKEERRRARCAGPILRPAAHRIGDARARVEEPQRGAGSTLANREEEGVEARVERVVDVSADLDEEIDDLYEPLGRRPLMR